MSCSTGHSLYDAKRDSKDQSRCHTCACILKTAKLEFADIADVRLLWQLSLDTISVWEQNLEAAAGHNHKGFPWPALMTMGKQWKANNGWSEHTVSVVSSCHMLMLW